MTISGKDSTKGEKDLSDRKNPRDLDGREYKY